MSAITIDDDLAHFEALGRGKPVVLVHGWLGSWRYWVPAMRQLAGKYRTYAIDLWGFGDSAHDTSRYNFEAQVTLLGEFMDRMGIKKAALIGHDLGAAVVARYAVRNPDRVPRLMTVAPPLFRIDRPRALTQNPAPEQAPDPSPATPEAPAAASPGADAAKPPVFSEAETVPWRNDDMKARIRSAIERQAKLQDASNASDKTGPDTPEAKSPREAATPPDEQPAPDDKKDDQQPAQDAGAPSESKPPVPETLSEVPQMPKLDYVPGDQALQMRKHNPLKDHLKTTDRFKLLETHVDDGPDRQKLRDEVEKVDPLAFSMLLESCGVVDTLGDLRKLTMPQMLVYGVQDTFLPQPDARMLEELADGRKPFKAMALAGNKHFPMLEEKAAFTRLLMEFLEASDVTQVKLAELWERRVR